eukprot:Gregarina_sp_Poly_1__9498@NODE_597_length_7261_cov_402_527940_g461_i0_p3_GENE_NODE_597_length_7261_cov_402_527940_g461_i0NODE_597_length_7261_cov_402_527940_g461_i0_p3_ORF_typecomplete_len419_score63_91Ribonuc_red_sm/PF00268_21/6_5e05Ribonuc_red_sm/PF00268_21/1_7e21_NODE_597_length_7261_cov_402_527940_g461_i0401296
MISVTELPESIVTDTERKAIREVQDTEEIFKSNPSRWVLLPVEYPTLWELYKKIETTFWTPEDFKWNQENGALDKACVAPTNRGLLLRLAVSYAMVHGVPSPSKSQPCVVSGRSKYAADGILFPDFLDLSCEFMESIQTPEGRAYLGFQSMMENFHREVFTKWIEVLLGAANLAETQVALRRHCLGALKHQELLEKQEWIHLHLQGFHYSSKIKALAGDIPDYIQTIATDGSRVVPLAEALVAFAVMKGIFFSALYLVPGLCGNTEDSALVKSSKKLLNDMFLHGDFAAHLYSSLNYKFSLSILKRLLVQAIELEYIYVMSLVGDSIAGFNRTEHGSLLRHICQRLLKVFGYTDDDDLTLPACNVPGDGQGLPKAFSLPPTVAFDHKGAFHIIPTEAADQMSSNATTQPGQFVTDADF